MTSQDALIRDVLANYEARVKGALLLEYRCKTRGCLLFRVWQSPNGPEFAALDTRTADFGRLSGGLHLHSIGRLDDCCSPQRLLFELKCSHTTHRLLVSEVRDDIKGCRPGQPRRVALPRQ